MLKKLIAIGAAAVVLWTLWHAQGPSAAPAPALTTTTATTPSTAQSARAQNDGARAAPSTSAKASPRVAPGAPDALERAIAAHAHEVPVTGSGLVTRVLREDLRGARHQRFLVRTEAGRTLLIAYNFDLAPRIAGLKAGGSLSFAGQYVWNDRGGLVHWTHRDPAHRHPEGYIRYDGHLYR